MSSPDPGLCGACRHVRTVTTDRGSVFRLCRRSRTDDRYPRYPRLPVRSCPGFERASESDDENDDGRVGASGPGESPRSGSSERGGA